MLRRLMLAIAVCALGAFNVGCKPGGDSGGTPGALPAELQRTGPSILTPGAADPADNPEQALQLVQTTLSEDGTNTYAAWVDNQLTEMGGSVLIPRWRSMRTGLHRYTVKFDIVHVDDPGAITRRGFAWEADLELKLVSPPRPLRPDELDAAPEPRTSKLRRELPFKSELETD